MLLRCLRGLSPALGTLILTFIPLAAQTTPPASEKDDQKRLEELLAPIHESIVITATPLAPAIDFRNAEVFNQTLFSRDDQVFHLLNAGINAGQHEGGGQITRDPPLRLQS